MKMWRQNMEYARRFVEMEQELAQEKLLTVHKFRQGIWLFIPNSKAVHQYLLRRFESNPNHLLKNFGHVTSPVVA